MFEVGEFVILSRKYGRLKPGVLYEVVERGSFHVMHETYYVRVKLPDCGNQVVSGPVAYGLEDTWIQPATPIDIDSLI
jgi:hypothetical protein